MCGGHTCWPKTLLFVCLVVRRERFQSMMIFTDKEIDGWEWTAQDWRWPTLGTTCCVSFTVLMDLFSSTNSSTKKTKQLVAATRKLYILCWARYKGIHRVDHRLLLIKVGESHENDWKIFFEIDSFLFHLIVEVLCSKYWCFFFQEMNLLWNFKVILSKIILKTPTSLLPNWAHGLAWSSGFNGVEVGSEELYGVYYRHHNT